MLIRLLSTQIPQFWDVIKFGVEHADSVHKDVLEYYLNELLLDLLNDKAQCFIRMNEEKRVQAIMITQVSVDKATQMKYLFLRCMYSFNVVRQEIWQQDFNFIVNFAKQVKCKFISFETSNERVIQLTESLNCRKAFTTMTYGLGGK